MKLNQKAVKILAGTLAATVLCTTTGILCFGAGADQSKETATKETPAQTETAKDGEEATLTKDETVYVLAGADGSVNKIIVSDWIKNVLSADSIEDTANLDNVQNVKGNESYTMDGSNMRVWDAAGNDIYYQGNIKKDLPVDLSVSYKLDGKTVSAEDLSGKSGKVTIRYDYKNNQKETVEIDGKEETINVPFVMLTGMLLDDATFRNVEVSNGKLINDGNHMAVIGVALPGLQENLDLSDDVFEIPDYVEITADVTNFSMNTTLTLATNEVFSALDLDDVKTMDELTGAVDTLVSSMQQLIDGSATLYDGMSTLLNKSGALVDGINRIADGAKELDEKMAYLGVKVGDLYSASSQIAAGTQKLSSESALLCGGAKQAKAATIAQINAELAAAGVTVTADNYAQVLDTLTAALGDPTNHALDVTATLKPVIVAQLTAAGVPQAYTDAAMVILADTLTADPSMSLEDATITMSAILSNASLVSSIQSSGMSPDATVMSAVVASNFASTPLAGADFNTQWGYLTAEQQGNITLLAKIAAYEAMMANDTITMSNVMDYITSATAMAGDAQTLMAAASDANATAKIAGICMTQAPAIATELGQAKQLITLYDGIVAYAAGVDTVNGYCNQLAQGVNTLLSGVNQLRNEGTAVLADGSAEMKNQVPALTDGITQLQNGSKSLHDNLQKFYDQGIKAVIDKVQGDVAPILTRLKATVDVSKNYKSFSGTTDEMDGNVKFIYKTESIG